MYIQNQIISKINYKNCTSNDSNTTNDTSRKCQWKSEIRKYLVRRVSAQGDYTVRTVKWQVASTVQLAIKYGLPNGPAAPYHKYGPQCVGKMI
jgi:hypothetical protein